MKMSSELVMSSPYRGSTSPKSRARYDRRYATAQPTGLTMEPNDSISPR
jgi:hypothetical protein